jgi:Ca2+-binding EF-hand superfamily protein
MVNFKLKESKSRFHIAFKMFDTDGNDQVDKKEFLVVCKSDFYVLIIIF